MSKPPIGIRRKNFLLIVVSKRQFHVQSSYTKNELLSKLSNLCLLATQDFLTLDSSSIIEKRTQLLPVSLKKSEHICTVGINIKFPYRLKNPVDLRCPNGLKTVTVYHFYGVYTATIFTRHFSSNSAQIHQ